MSNFRKGIACGVLGLSATGLGLSIGGTAEISPSSIEACANSLQEAGPSAVTIPDTCINTTYSVFPTSEVTSMVVSSGNENPYPFTTTNRVPMSADEYSRRAYEFKTNQESQVLLQKLASFALGFGVAGLAYYEWAINTPENRAAKQQNPAV